MGGSEIIITGGIQADVGGRDATQEMDWCWVESQRVPPLWPLPALKSHGPVPALLLTGP